MNEKTLGENIKEVIEKIKKNVVKIVKEIKKKVKTKKNEPNIIGRKIVKPDLKCNNNSNIQLVFLCKKIDNSMKARLFSSVKDGKLGTLVGIPALKSPNNCYDNYFSICLKNSFMSLKIPTKKYIKPNGNLSENTIIPDIEVLLENQALKAAIEFLKRKR